MSLPVGFLDELRSRVSISAVVGKKVVWDLRKSNQGRGDMWAPCPFHQEKTASFHVEDTKGYFYCFGCQAKGDIITFVKDTENVSFIEAVEILAAEAGLNMPARDPQAKEKAEQKHALVDIMEQAVRFFRLSLKTNAAADARRYLSGRGLSKEAQARFGIGFAPEDRSALIQHFKAAGVATEKLIETGLCIQPDEGRAPYDRFRGRIMFPIRDARGQCIAFGGRALDPAAKAKYLNSPETVLFDKGRTLYNMGPARKAVGPDQPLILAEGYMDVIALVEAGFEAAVAPLGTAITETQLSLLWRMTPEPIVALDGDKAGLRAAYRLIDLALPALEAGRALRFALMPEGQDPDDFIRQSGAGALRKLLQKSMPMVELLWQREMASGPFDSPERKAGLDKALASKTKLIKDHGLRLHYEAALKDLRWALFRNYGKRGQAASLPGKPQQSTKASALASGDDRVAQYIHEAVIVAAVLVCPAVLEDVRSLLEGVDFDDQNLNAMLRLMVLSKNQTRSELEAEIAAELGPQVIEKLFSAEHVRMAARLLDSDQTENVHATILETLGKLSSQKGLAAELKELQEAGEEALDETAVWRLKEAAIAGHNALKAVQEDKVQYQMARNGARINRSEKDRFDKILGGISFQKPKN
jgi:DNA primase